MSQYRVFTSESVSIGHPDKLADQISDAIVDAFLEKCPDARVACETLIKGQTVMLAGETRPSVACLGLNLKRLVCSVIEDAGYTKESGLDPESCCIINELGEQSEEIACGVDKQGAGDQGMMFGYATDETCVLMPAPIHYAHKLMRRQAELRSDCSWLLPDAKCQISLQYENDKPVAVRDVVLSTQHKEKISYEDLKKCVEDKIIRHVLPDEWIGHKTEFHINPAGSFEKGGPAADAGVTGRKIIVDTYGSMARHGGGAFSGKDPTKVDRSAAYAARYVAKNIVAAGLASRCEIQLSYAIGEPEPTSISVNTFGTGAHSDERIEKLVRKYFCLSPKGIIEMLDLKRPIYRKTATYGHFGREEPEFTWEETDRKDLLKRSC